MKSQKNWYFGWYIVIAASIITLMTVGLRMGIGPFVMPVMEDLNISRTAFSSIVAFSMIVYGVGMVLVGYIIQRFSTKVALILGVVLVNIAIFWTVNTQDLLGFTLSFGFLLSLGLAFISNVAFTPIISSWFTQLRGKALLFLSTGGMAGIAIMTPLETFLIDLIGWKETLVFFSIIFTVIILPSALFVFREKPTAEPLKSDSLTNNHNRGADVLDQFGHKVGLLTAIKTLPFWQIVTGLFICGFSMNLLGSHGLPMLTDHGFDRRTASFGIGFIGTTAILGTLLLGAIADRFARKSIIFWIYFIRGLGFLGLVLVVEPWQLFLVTGIAGLVWAGNTALSSAILGDLYGVRMVGVLYGWAFFGHQIGAAIGAFLGGWGYEVFGTHLFSFGITFILLIIASIVTLKIPKQLFFSMQTDTKEKALTTKA